MYMQKKALRQRSEAVVKALNSKEYKDSIVEYLEKLEIERLSA